VFTTRRAALTGALSSALALAACDRKAASQEAVIVTDEPLKDGAISRVGCCAMTAQFADPAFGPLLARHFSQLTPEWEMKMEYIVQDDGSFKWDAPDRLAAFVRQNGMKLYGTTLVWYAQNPPAFQRLDGAGEAFAKAYRDYITAVVGRYRGAVGWDVINESIAEDGTALREHIWSKNLGAEDHMMRAFDIAAEADPEAVLFINEYFLEKIPRKRLEYMRLIERLLKRGAKLGGIGNQSHLDVDVQPGAAKTAIRELASFGLPIHLSELDCSFSGNRTIDTRSVAEKRQIQASLAAEVAEAYCDLPEHQRFAFTIWGLRDKDSWLKKEPGNGADQPLMFDDAGQPKPMFEAVVRALKA